jgi:hypothetical protein
MAKILTANQKVNIDLLFLRKKLKSGGQDFFIKVLWNFNPGDCHESERRPNPKM